MKLRHAIESYIRLKQSLGFRFATDRQILKAFSRFMGKVRIGQVKPTSVRRFLDGNGPVTRNWERKWVALRGFYDFALARGLVRQSPVPVWAPKVARTFTPYVYSIAELRRLLQAIQPETMGKGLSASTLQTLLLLLYGAGLRISEALQLKEMDVDLEQSLLYIRCTKFFKTRLVPIGPKLAKALKVYAASCPETRDPERSFFRTDQGTPVTRSTVERIFRSLCVRAQVKRTDGGRYQPRLHDLRHAMATHCLVSWYRQGQDTRSLLMQLSAYLGHVDIAGTQKYLTMTPELRQQASTRFARYALGGAYE
jgi:site-specific recombinase XerD